MEITKPTKEQIMEARKVLYLASYFAQQEQLDKIKLEANIDVKDIL